MSFRAAYNRLHAIAAVCARMARSRTREDLNKMILQEIARWFDAIAKMTPLQKLWDVVKGVRFKLTVYESPAAVATITTRTVVDLGAGVRLRVMAVGSEEASSSYLLGWCGVVLIGAFRNASW